MTDPFSPARFDHVAIATWSIREAATLFIDVFGGELLRGADDERLEIRTMQVKLPPGIKIELMEPTSETSYLHRFLTKHGPGFHHVTLFFDDLEEAMERVIAAGFEVVDSELSDPRWRETFVRPSSGFGTLLQLVDTSLDWLTKDESITLEDIVEGRLVWEGPQAIRRKD